MVVFAACLFDRHMEKVFKGEKKGEDGIIKGGSYLARLFFHGSH